MSSRIRSLLLAACVGWLVTTSVMAATFVSLNGKFYFTYPDTWHQIDYRSVDIYLAQGRVPDQAFQYEAAFAPKDASPWYNDAFFILTVDTLGPVAQKQIDSILQNLAAALGAPMQSRNRSDLLNNLPVHQLVYDPATKTAAAITAEGGKKAGDKTGLLMLRFYDRGVANFYFYALDSTYKTNVATFSDIVASLSTENLEQAMPRETLKIADSSQLATRHVGTSNRRPLWIPAAGVLIVIIAVAVMARRRRRPAGTGQ